MLNKIKAFFFGTKPNKEPLIKPTPKKQEPRFTIEHYPKSGRYYPKFGKGYIRKDHSTGIYELIDSYLFAYANYGRTEDEAKEIIERYKEDGLKVGIINIELD